LQYLPHRLFQLKISWLWTFLVALFSGVAATSLFLGARHLAKSPFELAAVDCTQSMEVIFSLAGETFLLGGTFPGLMGWAGIALTLFGVVFTDAESVKSG
jgi:hypothetical protein